MGKITDIVKAWADTQSDSPNFQIDEDGNHATLKFTTSGEGDFSYRAFYEVRESTNTIELYLYAPIKVPLKKRSAVADVVARANHKAYCGRIDLDMDDGEIRFQSGYDIEGGQLSHEMLGNLIGIGNGMLDRYLPAISAVIYAGTAPADAIAQAKGDTTGNQTPPEPVPTQDALPWERIPGADLLQAWAQELRTACSLKDKEEWRDVGHAVVLVAEETTRCQEAVRRVAADAGMRYVIIEAGDVADFPPRAAFAKLAPALVYLEPGPWLLDRKKGDSEDDATEVAKFQKRLAKWISEFDVSRPVVLCTMVYELGDMSDTLDGTGRFDRYLALPPLTLAVRGEEFIEKLGRDRCGESLTSSPAKLGKLLDNGFAKSERRDQALLYMRRLSKREKRTVEFLDLMHISTHGFGEEGSVESSSDDIRRQVAAHEAGHAAIAILDSAGRNVPDYCSIVPGVGFTGIVAESIGYHQSLGDRTTYSDFRHDIRICLAGRAAEELVFGPERISNGASGDLENAWKRSRRAFARWGFAPQMEKANASSSNLAVIVGDPTSTESAYVESLIRQFLANEYEVVLKCLADNQAFLNAIAERLLWDPIVDQSELSDICRTQLKLDI